MKKFLLNLMIPALTATLALGMAACSDDDGDETPAGGTPSIVLSEPTSITATSVSFMVTPNSSSLGYKYAVAAAGQEEAFAAGTLIGAKDVAGSAQATLSVNDLTPDTDYTIYAMSIGANDTRSTVQTQTFKTAVMPEPSINISVPEANNIYATVDITVSNTSKYFIQVMTVEYYNQITAQYGTDLAIAQAYVDAGAEMQTSNLTGNVSLAGRPGIDYLVFIGAYNNANTLSKVEKQQFSSLPFDTTVGEATLEVEYDADAPLLTITPGEDVYAYVIDVWPSGMWSHINQEKNEDDFYKEEFIEDAFAYYGGQGSTELGVGFLTGEFETGLKYYSGSEINEIFIIPFNVNALDGIGEWFVVNANTGEWLSPESKVEGDSQALLNAIQNSIKSNFYRVDVNKFSRPKQIATLLR